MQQQAHLTQSTTSNLVNCHSHYHHSLNYDQPSFRPQIPNHIPQQQNSPPITAFSDQFNLPSSNILLVSQQLQQNQQQLQKKQDIYQNNNNNNNTQIPNNINNNFQNNNYINPSNIQLPPIQLPIERTSHIGTPLSQSVAISLSKSTSSILYSTPRHPTPLQLSKSSPSISSTLPHSSKFLTANPSTTTSNNLFDFYYPIKKVAKNPIGRPRSKRPERCAICKATETPEWRKGDKGQDLCNACGLKLRKEREARKMLILNNILNKDEPAEVNNKLQNSNFMDSNQYFTTILQNHQPTVSCRQSGGKCNRGKKENTSNMLPNKKLKM